jgi:hypothetical protein
MKDEPVRTAAARSALRKQIASRSASLARRDRENDQNRDPFRQSGRLDA